ncbi:MAG: SpaH/EbpB family LPXTG-anchored major pilin, partial [Ruminococcus sp.]
MFKSKNTKKKRLKKPIKRILSGVASVLMLATMIPSTVAVSASESNSPLVDMTMNGKASLTVTKYEMKDVSTATHIGTGEQESRVSEGGNIPNDAKVFSDVTFKISRIAPVDKYFGTDGKALPTVTEAKTMLGSADEIKSVTTDINGVAKFSNLKLGIYYVEETSHPAQVTKETAPFVVSVPFTATTGDKWLYDVYAYPKNQTNYANVTINKMDALSNKGIRNVEFALYRSTDNKATWSAVNNSANTNSYSTDASGKFTWENLPVNTYYKVKEVSVPDNKYILNNTTGKVTLIDET